MLDRKRRTIEISGLIPRVERQADENAVEEVAQGKLNRSNMNSKIKKHFLDEPAATTGSASITPITAGGQKVSNKGVTMIVAGDMADRFDSYQPRPVNNYYGHETVPGHGSPLVSSIFCSLFIVIMQFL